MNGRAVDFTPTYRTYVLGVLLAGYALDSLDRSVLAVLLQPIKTEFGLTDTQLGLLGGLAFAAFYSTLGLPLGLWADRSSRTRVLALSIVLWTVMTALCGLAASFPVLLLARIGTAVGEAGGSPASQSLISSYFPADRRGTALGLFALGAPAGAMLGGLLGGVGNEMLGWRTTLVLAGLPGLLLAPLVFFTVVEPRFDRTAQTRLKTAGEGHSPLRGVVKKLWGRASYRHLSFGCALHAAAMYGAATFNASFFSRSHGWGSASIGELIALNSAFGILGAFAGGALVDALSRRHQDQRWAMWVPALASAGMVPLQALVYLGAGGTVVIPAFLLCGMLTTMFFAPSFAATQALAANRMRAVAAALLIFVKTMLGMGIGPLLIGAISDRLAPLAGQNSLRYALLATVVFNAWSALHFLLAARSFRADLRATQSESVSDISIASRNWT